MKTLLINAYRDLRARMDQHIEAICLQAGIIRYGDHFVYGGILNRDSVVIDLGTNKGHFADLIAKSYQSRLFLVDANFALLNTLNIPNSTRVNAAITASEGEMTFYISANSEASSLDRNMAVQYDIIEERSVQCIPFSKLLTANNIAKVDLLKVDIEGAELDMFHSMSDEDILKSKQLAVEFHDFMMPGTLADVESVAARLVKLGYVQFKFTPLDWRRILFVHKDVLEVPDSFLRDIRRALRRSVMLDSFYYGTLRLLRGGK